MGKVVPLARKGQPNIEPVRVLSNMIAEYNADLEVFQQALKDFDAALVRHKTFWNKSVDIVIECVRRMDAVSHLKE